MSGRHNLTNEDGREVSFPVVYLDAYDGWVRETTLAQGQYATEVVTGWWDGAVYNHTGRTGRHRRPAHRMHWEDEIYPVFTVAAIAERV